MANESKADNGNLAPENFNDEQHDEAAQAQTVADQAMGRAVDSFGLEDGEKPDASITDEDSSEDLVDHMKQMEKGGIDMSAYRGEPNMDDNESKYGKSNVMKDEPANSDS
ncbi:hypothetical protein [Croceicoccus naphthovorans]|uniref:Uncharacterized protein n=1 Tax=Croceicoccus naphthovorans TaxID=1348774 RepID=A0A0G3XCT5_9SPHN|nr:hypothetical protein [Croceicoccus naphthovorans]AKM08997.1 hypothetical protein AB433_01850 [Croceicoccus naphthovorans]MBB3989189.1 hypothetical protein [Croceicoccus naphthovorans]